MKWEELGIYRMESAQIFFPASLEIQEELLKAGFKVPYDKNSGVKTSIPVISAFSQGREIKARNLLGSRNYSGNEIITLPEEDAFLKVLLNKQGYLSFQVEFKDYHLEDMGFTSVPPRMWNTWASFSIAPDVLQELMEKLNGFEGEDNLYINSLARRGHEIEIYAYKGRKYKEIGIPVYSYYFGLKNFKLAWKYFEEKCDENGVERERLNFLKLGLRKNKETRAGLKVGVSWFEGEIKRIILRLGTNYPRIKIQGLYGELWGKSRGRLDNGETQFVTVKAGDFYGALKKVNKTVGREIKN